VKQELEQWQHAFTSHAEALVPRTFDEIAEASNVRRREMWNAYRTIVLELDLKVLIHQDEEEQTTDSGLAEMLDKN
jgi:transcription initiation factor TFIIIB Brf1 subunit/transcription initiation factor TFIIB